MRLGRIVNLSVQMRLPGKPEAFVGEVAHDYEDDHA